MIKVHFTEAEKRQVITGLGFVIETASFGRFEQRTHGMPEWVENEQPAVVVETMQGKQKAIELDAAFDCIITAWVKCNITRMTGINARMALIDFSLKNNLKAIDHE
jgi:hypothetical protein